ncbi:MAG TPA: hypothetical protein VKB50_26540 [Vicinamibacterales bacterium]|nr:hypothetical protein [Vicinamibacterales bacterium]
MNPAAHQWQDHRLQKNKNNRRQISTMRHSTSLLLLAACLLLGAQANAAAQYWRCGNGRVTVISNSSAERCERLARYVLTFERAVIELVGWERDLELEPLTFYSLTRTDAKEVMFTQQDLVNQVKEHMTTYSKFLPDVDYHVAVIMDVGGDEPLESVMFLYGHSVVAQGNLVSYPPWFQFGISNVLNGMAVRPDGSVLFNRRLLFTAVVKGDEQPSALRTLQGLLATSYRDVTQATYNEVAKRALEFAHFGLLTGPERQKQYRDLAALMRQGMSPQEAVPEAFGISLDALSALYESGAWKKDISYRLAAPADLPTVAAGTPIDPTEIDKLLKVIADRVNAGQ